VWKFQYFSVIQILREINFGECISSKIAVLRALNFVLKLVDFTLQRVQKLMKMADFETLHSPTLISRKI